MREKQLRELAKSKDYYLYGGHAYGCMRALTRPEREECMRAFEADDGKAGEIMYADHTKPYTLEQVVDGRCVPMLVRIQLAEAEAFLTNGTIPDGHVIGEHQFDWAHGGSLSQS